MRKDFAAAAVLAAGLVVACDIDHQAITPKPPALSGVQIDRMARAGVNTAVSNQPFNLDASANSHSRDEYNSASDPAQWQSLFAGRIAANLAIIDSLDTVCGNQLLAGPAAVSGRYATLASVVADDRIYVNMGSGTCSQYLAVEANAVGIANSDCGGRTPLYDTIDTTYSVFAIGALAGVGDGIPVDPEGVPSLSQFPFLASPN